MKDQFICQHVIETVYHLMDTQILLNKEAVDFKLEELKNQNRIIDKMFCLKVEIFDIINSQKYDLNTANNAVINHKIVNTTKKVEDNVVYMKNTHQKQTVIDSFFKNENNIFSEEKKVKNAEFTPHRSAELTPQLLTYLRPQRAILIPSKHVSFDSGFMSVMKGVDDESTNIVDAVARERASSGDQNDHISFPAVENSVFNVYFPKIKCGSSKQSTLSNFGFNSINKQSNNYNYLGDRPGDSCLDAGCVNNTLLNTSVTHEHELSNPDKAVINDLRDAYCVPGTLFSDDKGHYIIHAKPFLCAARIGSAGGTTNAHIAFKKSNTKCDFKSFSNGESSVHTPHWFEDTVRWVPGMQKIIGEETRLNLINMPAVIFDKCKKFL